MDHQKVYQIRQVSLALTRSHSRSSARTMEPFTVTRPSQSFYCVKQIPSQELRSRDPALLDGCDIVVDVGAIYDAAAQRFDHHQRGFEEVFGHGFTTKLSSAGLIYKHFGKEIIAARTQVPVDDTKVHTLWLKLYQEFIEAIDANDNGISRYPTEIKPLYKSSTDLPSRVGSLNPAWNQSWDPQTLDTQFAKASALTGQEFLAKLDFYANACKQNVDATGKLVLLEQYFHGRYVHIPTRTLFDLERESLIEPTSTYVVYSDDGGNWRVQAVPVSEDSFESRKPLPEAWRGVRDDALSKISGVEGCVFVHASGFIGGTKTKEGALKLARLALEM
ncbi:metal-dependent protein hydrolase [Mucidula mucida]|nr:metal-dependent protein hydrolase [Mucidula mucida]